MAHLKALNVQVTDWIRRHIDENPLVILSPVFTDYEQYLKEITEKFPPSQASGGTTTTAAAAAGKAVTAGWEKTVAGEASSAPKGYTFGGLAAKKDEESAVSTGFKGGWQ